jgi:hypothetical protein
VIDDGFGGTALDIFTYSDHWDYIWNNIINGRFKFGEKIWLDELDVPRYTQVMMDPADLLDERGTLYETAGLRRAVASAIVHSGMIEIRAIGNAREYAVVELNEEYGWIAVHSGFEALDQTEETADSPVILYIEKFFPEMGEIFRALLSDGEADEDFDYETIDWNTLERIMEEWEAALLAYLSGTNPDGTETERIEFFEGFENIRAIFEILETMVD